MTEYEMLPHAAYPEGRTESDAVAVPTGASLAVAALARGEWTDVAVKAQLTVHASFDGGATWGSEEAFLHSFPCTVFGEGGVVADKFGNPVLWTTIAVDLPDMANGGRMLKVALDVSGAALTTSAKLMLS